LHIDVAGFSKAAGHSNIKRFLWTGSSGGAKKSREETMTPIPLLLLYYKYGNSKISKCMIILSSWSVVVQKFSPP
jgi:hypothetical protein